MEIILKEDIEKLGYKYDIITVKPGYARNYLIPQGKAIISTESNKKMVNELIKQASHKMEKLLKDAQAFSERIKNTSVTIKVKAGEKGKIFGTVTTLQISDALNAQGLEIDRKNIILKDKISELGTHTALIDLHKEIKPEIKVNVINDED